MSQQQRRQLDLQYQQSDIHTRLHVEPDSDGSEDGGRTTTTGGGASALVSELIATVPADSSITISAIIDDSQPPNLNSIPHSISRPISPLIPNPESNLESNPNLKFDARTNNHPKHTHTQSHYSHPGFHSGSHVAHMEDATESELDLNLDDDSDCDCDVGVSTVRVGGDALLPSLGYLDEALSFIAEERARWSAAREGGAVSAGGSGSGSGSAGVDSGFAKGGGGKIRKKTENRKVLGKFPFNFLRYVSSVWLCGVRVNAWWSFHFFGLSYVNVHE
jgi:hypothetical protein